MQEKVQQRSMTYVWKCKRTYYVAAVAMNVNIPPHPNSPHLPATPPTRPHTQNINTRKASYWRWHHKHGNNRIAQYMKFGYILFWDTPIGFRFLLVVFDLVFFFFLLDVFWGCCTWLQHAASDVEMILGHQESRLIEYFAGEIEVHPGEKKVWILLEVPAIILTAFMIRA